jgi:hypothetical protein
MAFRPSPNYRVTKIGANLGYKKILRNISAWINFHQKAPDALEAAGYRNPWRRDIDYAVAGELR